MPTSQQQPDLAPEGPPNPADLVEQLIVAAEKRGLKVTRIASAVLQFRQLPDYSHLDDTERVLAEQMFKGLMQYVVLLPDSDKSQENGKPLHLAWYWWWRGERLSRRTDEMERLADASAIDEAADRIARVLALLPSEV
ncbi:hypothetical protein [Nonomuraea recticatena]